MVSVLGIVITIQSFSLSFHHVALDILEPILWYIKRPSRGITMIQCPLKREKTWWRQLQAEILWKSAFKHLNPLDWNIDPVRHSYPGFRHTFNHLFAYNYSCLPVFQWKGNYVAQQLCMAVAVYSVHVMINSSHIPANTISSSNIWNRINDSVCSTHWNRLYKDIDRPKIITFEGKNKKLSSVFHLLIVYGLL